MGLQYTDSLAGSQKVKMYFVLVMVTLMFLETSVYRSRALDSETLCAVLQPANGPAFCIFLIAQFYKHKKMDILPSFCGLKVLLLAAAILHLRGNVNIQHTALQINGELGGFISMALI